MSENYNCAHPCSIITSQLPFYSLPAHVTLLTRPCDCPSCNQKRYGPGNEAMCTLAVSVAYKCNGALSHRNSPLPRSGRRMAKVG